MKISYIFSRNTLIGSRIISWASGLLIKDLDKIPSHVGVLIETKEFSVVVESVMGVGVRIVPYTRWLKFNELCYKVEENNNVDVFPFVNYMWGKKYDWPGIIYFAWRFLLHFLFKTSFPKTNLLQRHNRYFCNELVGVLSNYKGYSMVTPAKMCSDMLKKHI